MGFKLISLKIKEDIYIYIYNWKSTHMGAVIEAIDVSTNLMSFFRSFFMNTSCNLWSHSQERTCTRQCYSIDFQFLLCQQFLLVSIFFFFNKRFLAPRFSLSGNNSSLTTYVWMMVSIGTFYLLDFHFSIIFKESCFLIALEWIYTKETIQKAEICSCLGIVGNHLSRYQIFLFSNENLTWIVSYQFVLLLYNLAVKFFRIIVNFTAKSRLKELLSGLKYLTFLFNRWKKNC